MLLKKKGTITGQPHIGSWQSSNCKLLHKIKNIKLVLYKKKVLLDPSSTAPPYSSSRGSGFTSAMAWLWLKQLQHYGQNIPT